MSCRAAAAVQAGGPGVETGAACADDLATLDGPRGSAGMAALRAGRGVRASLALTRWGRQKLNKDACEAGPVSLASVASTGQKATKPSMRSARCGM